MTKALISSLLALTFPFAALAANTDRSGYRLDSERLCDGYPQVPVSTPEGLCVGLMAAKDNGLKMPRYATQGQDGIIYIADMGGWAYGRGTVWAYYRATSSGGASQTALVDLFPNKRLTMPNGILTDPEGRIYVGTPTGIVRFQPRNLKTGEFNIDSDPEVIVDQFAKSIFRQDEYKSAKEYNSLDAKLKNKHPLVQMTANKNFTEIYFNVGAPSNDCSRGIKTINDKNQCVQSESPLASAAIWKVELSATAERKILKVEPFARGLRNSMALAIHPQTQKVYQGENGIDLTDAEKPYEEINVLDFGKHYGWPYCHSAGEVAPFFVDKIQPDTCRKSYTAPAMFLPAHSAPLGMLFYQGQKISALQGKLLVALHGYAKYGHRVVGIQTSATGLAGDNKTTDIVFDWEAQPEVRPLGAPTGLLELQDGSLLILDDKNGAILRLSTGAKYQGEQEVIANQPIFSEKAIQNFRSILPLLQKNCVLCHAEFGMGSAEAVLMGLHKNGMLNLKTPAESAIYRKLKKREMPPDFIRGQLGFKDQDAEQLDLLIENFIRGL